jgi:hypothetical protein
MTYNLAETVTNGNDVTVTIGASVTNYFSHFQIFYNKSAFEKFLQPLQ